MGRLEGRIALVTGAASGIGRACARTLAREGAKVVMTDMQDAKGEAVAAEIEAADGSAVFLHHDVTSEDAWVDVIAEVSRRHGRLDILVNNAGIAITCPSITEMSLADFKRQQAVNVEGVFLGLKHGIPLMRRSGEGGSIINLSSVAGLKGATTLAAYSATKGAVRLLTKAVALECGEAHDKIRVNSVHPGVIDTAIWEGMHHVPTKGANGLADLDAITRRGVPLGYTGQPEDIADGVLWLASDESRYVTGTELVIDGGLNAR
jgi:NAD(P)-dependent dehydrogenase (short-subunit alcohol dehydrogenase family)